MMPDCPRVLLIIDPADTAHVDGPIDSERWVLHRMIIDYRRLFDRIEEINRYVAENHIDFVMYSRNDQVAGRVRIGAINRRLSCGYSSFSGIDDRYRVLQMKECYNDFIRCDARPVLDADVGQCEGHSSGQANGTFSLLFDTEQAGCVRHALPRILPLLMKYRVNATFFLTNLMKKMYPSLPGTLESLGHEAGIHGLWHESLVGMGRERQIMEIGAMKADLGAIHGANFVGRMDVDTVHAMSVNNLQYFVYPALNKYRAFSYPKLATGIINVAAGSRVIRMVPISLETYSNPWFSVRSMVDAACDSNRSSGQHITILCHPFRDGNLQHIGDLERLLEYLTIRLKMKPVLVSELEGGARTVDACSYDRSMSKPGIFGTLPHATRDLIDMAPQNAMLLYRLICRRRTIW